MPSPVPRRSLFAVLAGAALLCPAPASAVISSAQVLAGPSADVLSVDGVAMAEDGTGGVVFRKREDGRTRVFVSQFGDGRWSPPQRVDLGQRFNSSAPAIGAGNDGRLVVTWVHEFGGGTQNRLFGATLDPGAARFQAPVPIDLDVREGLDLAPSLSMARGGQAWMTYRVVYSRQDPILPPGYVDADVRLARFNGQHWSTVGQPVDRNQAQPVRRPTLLNGPQVATDASGNAVVVWQEPDDELIDRIYARRLFSGGVLGNVLPVSPATAGDKPLRGNADQLSLDVSRFGQAAVGFRQQPGSQGAFTRARAMVNLLPSALSDKAAAFLGARAVDGAGPDGPEDELGPVDVAVQDDGTFEAGTAIGRASVLTGGDEAAVGTPARLDDGAGAVSGDPVLDRGAGGALAAAWRVGDGAGAGGVGVLERRADGTPTQRLVAAPGGGDVGELLLSGSGLGDALVAFRQGDAGGAQVVVAVVDAPPGTFTVATPPSWTNEDRIELRWDPVPNGVGRVAYELQVDGETVGAGQRGLRRTVRADQVGDGSHDVQVVATDGAGQTTTSVEAKLLIDQTPPRVRTVKRGRRGARVTVTDGARGQVSGVASTTVRWGDGRSSSTARATHRYRKAGRYRVRVTTTDEAGNRRTTTTRVTVR